MKKVCLQCNKDFENRYKKVKYCSYDCAYSSKERLEKIKKARENYYANGGRGPTYWLGKKRPKEAIEKFKKSMKGKMTGDKNPNWKGGITNPRTKIMKSDRYKKWREQVFIRDDFTCQNCGVKSGCGKTVILQADHIKPFSLFPELRFDLDNGRTLCKQCHEKTETFGGRAVRLKNKQFT